MTFASTTPAVCTVAGSVASLVTAGTCTITADQGGNANYLAAPQVSRSLTVTPATATLTVTATPNGLGSVSFNGQTCLNTCIGTYNVGSVVALTATPSPNYSFSGWSGACTGTGACSVSMTGNLSVTATFATTAAPASPRPSV